MNSQRAGIHYYGVLNLREDCNDSEINKAHLATYYHIRRQNNTDILEHSRLIAESYDVLSNPLQRAIYDHYGEIGLKRGVSGPNGYIPPYAFHGDAHSTFRDFFGTSNPYGDFLNILENLEMIKSMNEQDLSNRNEQSLMIPLPLTLTEIFFGAVKKFEIARLAFLNGENVDSFLGDETLNILVEPGLPSATQIIFIGKGRGETSRVVDAKIVFVTEDVPHKKFIREEDNLIMTVDVLLNDALRGIVLVVDTLDDRILRIPVAPIAMAEYEKCVVGEGLPLLAKQNLRGDLILRFKIEFPMDSTVIRKYHNSRKLRLKGKNRRNN